jgi:pimeloyl-ACP methyl ester carboxylesterase
MAERFDVSRDGTTLAGERWLGGGQTVLLLHEGVADRRGWAEVARLLAPELTLVAYDRRGYGQTPVSTEPFSHLDDLLAVIGHAGAGPVWLAGASAGGGLALDAALIAPDRVAGLVVMGTAVSGAPNPSSTPLPSGLSCCWIRPTRRGTPARSTAWRPGCGWTAPASPRGEWAAPRGSWHST